MGERLVARGYISPAQLASALELQRSIRPRKLLGEVIAEQGWMSHADVIQELAELTCKPYSDLQDICIDQTAVDLLPREYLERHNLLPIAATDTVLTVAIERFTDVNLASDIARRTQRDVIAIAAIPDAIRAARDAHRAKHECQPSSPADGNGSLSQLLESMDVTLEVVDQDPEPDLSLESASSDSPNVKLVNFIFKSALEARASDIHIEPGHNSFQVRFRIDGDLVTAIQPPARLAAGAVSRIKILADMDISERRLPQDGSVTIRLLDRSVDLRISTMATRFGEKVVIRILNRDDGPPALDRLGMSERVLSEFRTLCAMPHGMVLVTGPTGSGKSTTLYAGLYQLSSKLINISTIEDPIEHDLPNVSQFQIHQAAGFTFGRALRSMLRQDPDVIMVGEIRDSETARLATEAALTGHLVLSTLHTNDTRTAVPRLINMGVDAFMVAAALRGVLAQRLVKKLCPHCKVHSAPTEAERRWLNIAQCPPMSGEQMMDAPGCQRCSNRGYNGRIGLFDILLLSESDIHAMLDHAPHSIDATPASNGLLIDGLEKVCAGLISLRSLKGIAASLGEDEHQLPAARAS